MKYYAFNPGENNLIPLGTQNQAVIEAKSTLGAIRMINRRAFNWGWKFTVMFVAPDFYNTKSYKLVYNDSPMPNEYWQKKVLD